MKLPIGVSDFKEIQRDKYTLIDKTLLIKDIIDEGSKVVLFTRPRRFGKTLNMSMLYHYFSLNENDSSELFKDLAIWQQDEKYQQHQGKYPVIFVTLKGVKYDTFDQAYEKLISIISELYSQYRFLLSGDILEQDEKDIFKLIIQRRADQISTELALKSLVRYLHRFHKIKPILLIDEYDSPIHSGYTNNYYKKIVGFMQHFLGEALKDNIHLHKGIVTGILRVAKESIFSGLNNLEIYSTLEREYNQYFGFTQTEVDDLLKQSNLTQYRDEVQSWYNGYHFRGIDIYNPWSILKCIKAKGEFGSYWVNTSDNRLIDKLLLSSTSISKANFESLLQSQAINQMIEEDLVFTDIEKRANALWIFLHHTGYLTVTNVTQDPSGFYRGDFMIPNREVALLYKTFIIRWFGTEYTPSTNSITQYLINGDVKNFSKLLGRFLVESFSYFDTQGKTPEQIYHVFVLGLIAHLTEHYLIRSNRESGDGRYDVVIMPKDKTRTGIILEFKSLEKGATSETLKKEAQKALDQIKEKNYVVDFDQAGISSVLQLGAAFSGKHCEVLPDNSRV